LDNSFFDHLGDAMAIPAVLIYLVLGIVIALLVTYARVVWKWGRVLWVCRVPFVSAFGGGLLLAATPQARDCFSDLGLENWQWAIFLSFTLIWAWIVHASARRALLADDWVPEAQCPGGLSQDRRNALRTEFELPAIWVPRLLGLSVPVFVLFALWRARDNLTGATIALSEADDAVWQIDWLIGWTVVVILLYLTWIAVRRPLRGRMAAALAAVEGAPAAPAAGPAAEPALLMGELPVPLSWRLSHLPARLVAAPGFTIVEILLTLVGIAITLFFIFAFVSPQAGADLLPRVLVVPVLFGGFVLALGEVAMWSMRLRTPLLLLVVLLSCVFLFGAEHYHDIRFVDAFVDAKAPPSPMRGASPQIHFDEAVARWRRVNSDCDPDAAADRNKCPRPILIAGAGGASRAAFMTATVVGALIDLGNDRPDTYGNVRNRIFAMSTVSGSSLGAVVMRAALSDAGETEDPNQPPCAQDTGKRSWFRHRVGANVTPKYISYKGSWRDCFQLLLAGDFLSPVMLGLFYRDSFPVESGSPGKPWWGDRAVLLEQAFERRYSEVIGGPRVECTDDDFTRGLCRPFGYHPDPGDKKTWLPLLFINGTSVWTGRRIIASDIAMGDCGGKITAPMFPFAYDVREYLSPTNLDRCPPSANGKTVRGVVDLPNRGQQDDIRLSSAATISARFPVISPQGNFRDPGGMRTDEVVDGGYFENDGLATIGDVAAALRQYHLDPAVIRIVNEPSETSQAAPADAARPPPGGGVDERTWFDDFTSIFRTLVSTRTGHLDGHEAYVKGILTNEKRLIRIGVDDTLQTTDMPGGANAENPLCRWEVRARQSGDEPKPTVMKNVSMSWWMSHPVQAYIDAQLCKRENAQILLCELEGGKQGATKSCPPEVAAK
jgi:hypothetical protein